MIRTALVSLAVLIALVVIMNTAAAAGTHCPDGGTIPPMPGPECTETQPPVATPPSWPRVYLPVVMG